MRRTRSRADMYRDRTACSLRAMRWLTLMCSAHQGKASMLSRRMCWRMCRDRTTNTLPTTRRRAAKTQCRAGTASNALHSPQTCPLDTPGTSPTSWRQLLSILCPANTECSRPVLPGPRCERTSPLGTVGMPAQAHHTTCQAGTTCTGPATSCREATACLRGRGCTCLGRLRPAASSRCQRGSMCTLCGCCW